MSSRFIRWLTAGALGLVFSVGVCSPVPASAQEISRKVKTKVAPAYPDLARRLAVTGTVKIAVVVAPNGTVKSTKVVGGHPLLCDAAVEAVKKWKFEPDAEESSGVVEFRFQPDNN